ncbi:MAG TPA: DUF4919 domain-containing protein [Geobacteraceae bacterium]
MKILLAMLFVAMCSCAFAAQANTEAQKEFDALLAKVKQSDESVDFAQLRRLYSQTESYSPFGDNPPQEMFAALNNSDFKKSRSLAEEVLDENYLNVDAHLVERLACDKLKDEKCSAHHRYVARGIIDSILRSGDGKTPETAMFVISIAEEYLAARALGLRVVSQALEHITGHSYDVLTVVDAKTNAEGRLYFNIDVISAAEERMFQKKGN